MRVAWRRFRWLIFAAVLLGMAALSQAAFEGRTFTVDASADPAEDADGDFTFHSLQAVFNPDHMPHAQQNDLILVRPGQYEETVRIDVAGVTVRSEGGLSLTTVVGGFVVAAKQVKLQGFTIDASGRPHGIRVDNVPHFEATKLRISGAQEAGIKLEGAFEATVTYLQAHNNSGVGLLAQGADDLSVSHSRFEANATSGAALQQLKRFSLFNNEFSLNAASGLRLDHTQEGQLRENLLRNNNTHGLHDSDSEHNTLTGNTFAENGAYGLVLERTAQHNVELNTVSDNGGQQPETGGILLLGASTGNTLTGNGVRGHSDPAGTGIRLLGAASANRLIKNKLMANQVGVRLDQEDALGRPQTNLLQGNLIEGSHGPGVFSSGLNNRYEANILDANNGPGFEFSEAEGEQLVGNTITGNSQAGVLANLTVQLKLIDNTLMGNTNGVMAQNVSQSHFEGNHIQGNHGKGIKVLRGSELKLLKNTLIGNREDGIWLDNTEQVTVSGNAFLDNEEVGLQLENTEHTDVSDNGFQGNQGALTVWGGADISIQFNNFNENESFGIWVMDAQDLDARYNFWGSGQGPSGLSPTREFENDLARNITREQVFPWLSLPVVQVERPTVKGWWLQGQPGPELHHAPQAGVSFDLSRLTLPLEGWFIVFRAIRRPEGAPAVGEEFGRFSVFTGGRLEGTVTLVMAYDPEALPVEAPVDDLRLYLWDGVQWRVLDSAVNTNAHTLTSDVPSQDLEDATVVMAWPRQRELTQSDWVSSRPTWIVGEALHARLRDPDKNVNPAERDRIVGAVQVFEEGEPTWVLDALETGPSSGEFEVVWDAAIGGGARVGQTVQLKYVDPEAPQDHCLLTVQVTGRSPFVVDPHAQDGDDVNYDFRFKTWDGVLEQAPSLQPNETVYLEAGVHRGDWVIDVAGVTVVARPGAELVGSLTLAADDIKLRGLLLRSEAPVALRVAGDRVSLRDIQIRSSGQTALRVEGDGFSLQGAEVEAAQTAIELFGQGAKITRNAIIGSPALVQHTPVLEPRDQLSVDENWWGSAGGPGQDVQGLPQEDVFPWLLTPPVHSNEQSVYVEGTTWSHPNVWQILSDMGQALLVQDWSNLWDRLKQLFGQGDSRLTVFPSWSLHVNAPSGRLIVTEGAAGLAPWMPEDARRVGLWLDAKPNARVRLAFAGERAPQVWSLQQGAWTPLAPRRTPDGGWQMDLPLLLQETPMPLWLALSGP